MDWLEEAARNGTYALEIAVFRAVPFLAVVLIGRRSKAWSKLSWTAAFLSSLVACVALDEEYIVSLSGLALVYLYFFFAALAFYYALWPSALSNRIKKESLLLSLVALFWIIPSKVFEKSAPDEAVVLGFNVLLSSYSIYLDGSQGGKRPSLSASLFFLLVNPVLVFTHRGRKAEGSRGRLQGAARVLLGVCTIFAGVFLFKLLGRHVTGRKLASGLAQLSVYAPAALAYFFAFYWTH
jgi:hypothetical protein